MYADNFIIYCPKRINYLQDTLLLFSSLPPKHPSTKKTSKSIISRPLDLIYVIYFATHIPVTMDIDFQIFYPHHSVPQVLKDALDMYITVYKDRFMDSPTPVYWFLSFVCCELVVQLLFFFITYFALVKGI
jgi:hypothetical protein